MRVVSLGSGSSGNALLVQTGRTAVLVDAGFSRRTLISRLRQVGVTPAMLGAIFLTHEHSDHACGAASLALHCGIPLVSDPRTLRAVLAQPSATVPNPAAVERIELPVGRATKLHDLDVRSFPISHDAVAPCGYILSTGAWSVFLATDTGHAGPAMVEAMRGAHLLVVESNHDVERLRVGPYPWHLKRRILSDTGHLSNEQAGTALVGALDDGPHWIWLAHLSRTNNTPDLASVQVRSLLRSNGLRTPVQVAPPDVGPVWDSSSLWGSGAAQPIRVAAPASPAAVVAPVSAPTE